MGVDSAPLEVSIPRQTRQPCAPAIPADVS